MKTTAVFFIFLFIAFISSAQNIMVTDTILHFGITEKGKADGIKTEKIIGKDGGTLASSDGKVEIIIPADVLLQNTTFSIQPVTPMAQGAIGKGYDLEPSGIQFKKQVTFIYHYSMEETEESSPELMGLAFRNNEGFWRQINSVVTDTIAKTIIGKISHFSEWGTEWKIFFQARDKRVKAGKQTKIYLFIAPKDEKNPDEKDVSNAVEELFGPHTSTKFYVNNVLHGNNTEGFMASEKNFNQVYQAPQVVPDKNPVTLKVEIYDQLYYKIHGSYMTRTCKVQIYDNGYEVKMVANMVGGSRDTWGGIVINKDEGSFVVSMEKDKPEVINIKNNLERLINNCDKTILNPTTCTGLIHVAGTKAIKVTPANPPGQPYAIVEIWFVQYPIELTRYNFTCKPPPGYKHGSSKGKIGLETAPPMLAMFGMPAIPSYIKFVAKDGEQVLVQKGEEGSDIYYKIWVTKIKEQ